jgi:hypothetical protein
MAFPTAMNDQIPDAGSPANLKVMDDPPVPELGDVYAAVSHAFANAARNSPPSRQPAPVIVDATNDPAASDQQLYDIGSSDKAADVLGLDRLAIPGLDILTAGLGDDSN